jgi:peroxiredoxin
VYAEITDDELAVDSNIVLEPWGRLEGEFRVGGRASAGESVTIDYYQERQQGNGIRWSNNGRQTDADGRFSLDRLVAGAVRICYMYKLKGVMNTHTRQEIVEIVPGETSKITIGGSGRAVTGRFVAVGSEPIEWGKGQVSLDLKLPEPAYPDDFEEMIFVERSRWNYEWRKTEQGREYEKMEWERGRSYRAKIDADGTFRVDDVPVGEYELRACIGSKLGGTALLGARKPIPVPDYEFMVHDVNERDSGEPLELGVIKIGDDKSPKVGGQAAGFEAETFEGQRINLADFSGKVVLLTFWKSEEPYHGSGLAYALDLCDIFKNNERFVGLGMSLDRDVEGARKFAEDNELEWINCIPSPGSRVKVSDDYEVWTFPMMYVIGPRGRILAILPPETSLKTVLEEALSEE